MILCVFRLISFFLCLFFSLSLVALSARHSAMVEDARRSLEQQKTAEAEARKRASEEGNNNNNSNNTTGNNSSNKNEAMKTIGVAVGKAAYNNLKGFIPLIGNFLPSF